MSSELNVSSSLNVAKGGNARECNEGGGGSRNGLELQSTLRALGSSICDVIIVIGTKCAASGAFRDRGPSGERAGNDGGNALRERGEREAFCTERRSESITELCERNQ